MGTIRRQDVERLADFHAPNHNAVTFYFIPRTPQDNSHREEAIRLKDMLRNSELRETTKSHGLKNDLDKIQQRAEELDHAGESKAIFACSDRGIYEEYDIPTLEGETSLHVSRQFHLKPLISVLEHSEAVCIVLIDREVNRLLKMQYGKLVEERFPDQEERDVRTVGTGDSTKSERRVGHEIAMHYKSLCNHLLSLYERGEFDLLVVGGRDEMVPVFTQYFASPVQKVYVSSFHCDPGLAQHPQIQDEVERMLEERREAERQGLMREIEGQAKRNGKGALGLAKVLQSIERGEVQQVVIGRDFAAKGVVCPVCEHLDSRMLDQCAACGTRTLELDDITDTVIARAFGSKAGVVVTNDDDFANNIGALLRFRADQNTSEKLAS